MAEPGVRAAPETASEPAGESAVLLKHGRGSGRTLFLNLLILDYPRDRYHAPSRAAWLRRKLWPHLLHAGLRPRLVFTPDPESPAWPVGLMVRRDGERLFLAAFLNLAPGEDEVPWAAVAASPEVRGRLRLPRTGPVRDLWTHQDLGRKRSLDVVLTPDRPAVFLLGEPPPPEERKRE